ncbi:MAG: UDP-glucose--hexose-1-phosphate uridylyltransferase [Candidatus Riflebacteria bacterium]|nr:UDP-glucose--hexose-1-phosphate uridylyltransferase [Candidatus Riflebacteria bacterium]
MDLSKLADGPHRRFNPLTRQWVLVSPQRTHRPWQGQVEARPPEHRPRYEPGCYLCPGNVRAGGERNPDYQRTFVFDNDFPALLPDRGPASFEVQGLLLAATEPGLCRVVCFSPRHDLTLARMSGQTVRAVVDVWAAQVEEVGARPSVGYVQIFENRGEMMGASNPHPHGQLWATASVPNEPATEQASLDDYRARRGHCLLCDLGDLEARVAERLVLASRYFLVVVPFWAIWPFETMVLPRRHVASLEQLDEAERDDLARTLVRLTATYDRVFEVSFPYSMGFHQRPTDGQEHAEWHLHAHFYPPLLRSATVRKFMVGYEMLGMPQRDVTSESAAARLRELLVPTRVSTSRKRP